MNDLSRLNWPVIVGLGAFALIRPLSRILASHTGLDLPGAAPLVLTLVTTLVWILVAGLSRVPAPLPTLVLAALTYAVLSMVLSAPLSLLLDGALAGPLTNPFAVVSVLVVNAIWGLAAGALALLVRLLSRPRPADRA